MLFKYSKLKEKVEEKFGTHIKFAKAIGISERSVSAKLNGHGEWKQGEILKACEMMDIEIDKVHLYFFDMAN